MAELIIKQNGTVSKIVFEAPRGLEELLREAGCHLPHPCGGRGVCAKCAVELEGNVSSPTEAEIKAGTRLSCQTAVLGDATVVLPEDASMKQIETGIGELPEVFNPMPGAYGAAVDIGTTTVAVRIYDLASGSCVGNSSALNPQTSVAADVMGRIEAACKGELSYLNKQITDCISGLLKSAGMGVSFESVDSMVVTGNTTMLYLLTEHDPEPLSHAPFEADTLFDTNVTLFGSNVYLPACMNAFVGADITCAVLSSEMCESGDTALLCDIGTNGELALWKDGKLYVTSTAAGPAFEGAGISCGCGSINGAIDKVFTEDGKLKIHTIGDAPPVGLCGSGLIDAVAAGLELGEIDETGALEEDEMFLGGDVRLMPKDIRAVQLAKAAIAAGIVTLLETAGTSLEDIGTLYIAGGFGSHLNVENAAAIGLIPSELTERVRILGNAALSGCVRALLNVDELQKLRDIAALSEHVNLGGNPQFNENYIDKMMFE